MALTSTTSGVALLLMTIPLAVIVLLVLVLICAWFRKGKKEKHGQDTEKGNNGEYSYAPLKAADVAQAQSAEKKTTSYARLETSEDPDKHMADRENTRGTEGVEETERDPLMTETVEDEVPCNTITSTVSPDNDKAATTEIAPLVTVSVETHSVEPPEKPAAVTREAPVDMPTGSLRQTSTEPAHPKTETEAIPTETDAVMSPLNVDVAVTSVTTQSCHSVPHPQVDNALGTGEVSIKTDAIGTTSETVGTTIQIDTNVTSVVDTKESREAHIIPNTNVETQNGRISHEAEKQLNAFETGKIDDDEAAVDIESQVDIQKTTTGVNSVTADVKVTETITDSIETEIATSESGTRALSDNTCDSKFGLSGSKSSDIKADSHQLPATAINTNGHADDRAASESDEMNIFRTNGMMGETDLDAVSSPATQSTVLSEPDRPLTQTTTTEHPVGDLTKETFQTTETDVYVDNTNPPHVPNDSEYVISVKSEKITTTKKVTKIPTPARAVPATSPVQNESETGHVVPATKGTKIPTFGRAGSTDKPQRSPSIEVPNESSESLNVTPKSGTKIPALSRISPGQSATKTNVSKIPPKSETAVITGKTAVVATSTKKQTTEKPEHAPSGTVVSPVRTSDTTPSAKPTRIPSISTKIPTSKRTSADVTSAKVSPAVRPTKLNIDDPNPTDKTKTTLSSDGAGGVTSPTKDNKRQIPTATAVSPRTESVGSPTASSAAVSPAKADSAETPTRATGIPRPATKIPTSRRSVSDGTPGKNVSEVTHTKQDAANNEVTPTRTDSSRIPRIPTLTKASPTASQTKSDGDKFKRDALRRSSGGQKVGKESSDDQMERSKEKTRIPLPSSGSRAQDTT